MRVWRDVYEDRLAMVAGGALVAAIAMTTVRSGLAGGLYWSLAILGLILLIRDHFSDARRLTGPQWRLIVMITAAPYLMNLLSVWVNSLPLREASWYPLLAMPLLLRVAGGFRLGIDTLQRGALWGNGLALLMVLVAGLWFGDARTYLPGNVIIFGQIVMALCTINAWTLGAERRPALRALAAVTLLAGITSVMAVGYRGALLCLPLVIISYVLACRCESTLPWRKLAARGAVVCLALTAFAVIAGSFLSMGDRLILFQSEFSTYQSGRIDHSSSGSRLALWQAAMTLFARHPWFGVGAHQFHNGLDRLRLENAFPGDVSLFDHAHNTYLNLAAEYGLVGLIVFAGLAVVLWRALQGPDRATRLLGRCVLMCWLVAALTNDITAHQATMRAFLLMLIPCLACGPLMTGRQRPRQTDTGPTATVPESTTVGLEPSKVVPDPDYSNLHERA